MRTGTARPRYRAITSVQRRETIPYQQNAALAALLCSAI